MITVPFGSVSGALTVPSSKSQLHRALILAAFSEAPCQISFFGSLGADIRSTIGCLQTLGAEISVADGCIRITPVKTPPPSVIMDAGQSGSTLRFLLPVLGALGVSGKITMQGRLPERPIEPLIGCLRLHGQSVQQEGSSLFCSGKLLPGDYAICAEISSQFVSGLLLALSLLEAESTLHLTGSLPSAPYVAMTVSSLQTAGVPVQKLDSGYRVTGRFPCAFPSRFAPEGDWSAAAAFLAMGAFSQKGLSLGNLSPHSVQADAAMLSVLQQHGAAFSLENGVFIREGGHRPICADGSDCPDLLPVLAVLASSCEEESCLSGVLRLAYKESDRLLATKELLSALNAQYRQDADTLRIRGGRQTGSFSFHPHNDHRMAMAAAAASCFSGDLTVWEEACVQKSYPAFWQELFRLKGVPL